MTEVMQKFSIQMQQIDSYEFKVTFDKEQYEDLYIDEPAPLGHDEAPNAVRILAAAIGNCLSASLLFCLSKQKKKLEGMSSTVEVEIVRTEQRRLRVGKVNVVLHPALDADDATLAHCRDLFEDFCVVTQSVRQGIDVDVKLEPTGAR